MQIFAAQMVSALWAAVLDSRLLSCIVSSSADNEKPARATQGMAHVKRAATTCNVTPLWHKREAAARGAAACVQQLDRSHGQVMAALEPMMATATRSASSASCAPAGTSRISNSRRALRSTPSPMDARCSAAADRSVPAA